MMNRTSFLLLLVVAVLSLGLMLVTLAGSRAAIADHLPDSVSGACQNGSYGQLELGDVLECRDGVWRKIGLVGTQQITLRVELFEHGKLVHQSVVTTLSGQPTPVIVEREVTYLAKAVYQDGVLVRTPETIRVGFHVILLPRLVNGDISVVVRGAQKDIVSMQRVGTGDLAVDLPQVNVFRFDEQVRIRNGRSMDVASDNRYTLKVAASKG